MSPTALDVWAACVAAVSEFASAGATASVATTATTAAMIATREIVAILPGLSACRVAALRVDAERILEGSELDAPLGQSVAQPSMTEGA